MVEQQGLEQTKYLEMQDLTKALHHHLITLATSLKGRLSPAEENDLAHLFRAQIDLQILLEEAASAKTTWPLVEAQPDNNGATHAQALQYARDLARTIRQKKDQQRRLELTSQQLIRVEKLATVGHVAASVAHELSNILAPLMVHAKIVDQENVKQPNGEVELSTQVTRITNRASHMLSQLMTAARSESTSAISVNLVEVIQNALALLTPRIKKQNIWVEQYYPNNPPFVMGNANQLQQVFTNLALNAFDAMPNGGNFIITVRTKNNKTSLPVEPDYIMIHISDSGIGIPPENIELIFEPFYTTKPQDTSGLGLFVSTLIIDRYRGIIEVESELGVGTTFTIKLPLADET